MKKVILFNMTFLLLLVTTSIATIAGYPIPEIIGKVSFWVVMSSFLLMVLIYIPHHIEKDDTGTYAAKIGFWIGLVLLYGLVINSLPIYDPQNSLQPFHLSMVVILMFFVSPLMDIIKNITNFTFARFCKSKIR